MEGEPDAAEVRVRAAPGFSGSRSTGPKSRSFGAGTAAQRFPASDEFAANVGFVGTAPAERVVDGPRAAGTCGSARQSASNARDLGDSCGSVDCGIAE
jgi:hypothetical protein